MRSHGIVMVLICGRYKEVFSFGRIIDIELNYVVILVKQSVVYPHNDFEEVGVLEIIE